VRKDGQVDFNKCCAGMLTRLNGNILERESNPLSLWSSKFNTALRPMVCLLGYVERVVNRIIVGANRQGCVSAVNSFAQLDLRLLFPCNWNLGAVPSGSFKLQLEFRVWGWFFFSGNTRFETRQFYQLPWSFSRSQISVCVVWPLPSIFVQNYSHYFTTLNNVRTWYSRK
jgi:hypothetical protein